MRRLIWDVDKVEAQDHHRRHEAPMEAYLWYSKPRPFLDETAIWIHVCPFSVLCLSIRLTTFDPSQLSWCMGYIADNSRKFFHPAAIDEMLSTFLPLFDGTRLDVRILIHDCFCINWRTNRQSSLHNIILWRSFLWLIPNITFLCYYACGSQSTPTCLMNGCCILYPS
jgi:hypothetical protein